VVLPSATRSRYIRAALAIVSSSYFLGAGMIRFFLSLLDHTLRRTQGGSRTG
jgi:hypothetical protein